MIGIIKLKPARDGLIVRDPVTMVPLPSEGKEVERNSYWLRRMAAGDVVEAVEAVVVKVKSNKKGDINVD